MSDNAVTELWKDYLAEVIRGKWDAHDAELHAHLAFVAGLIAGIECTKKLSTMCDDGEELRAAILRLVTEARASVIAGVVDWKVRHGGGQ